MADTKSTQLLETVLHQWHVSNGGRLVEFAGYAMPVHYSDGILTEHAATRTHAGLFDISHMGRFMIRGPDSHRFLSRVLTSNVQSLQPMRAQYCFIADQHGYALDDAYLYNLDGHYLLVVNASNRDKDWQWLTSASRDYNVELDDESTTLGMIALQGPRSDAILEQAFDGPLLIEAQRNRLAWASVSGKQLLLSRTGYTGEKTCFEIFIETGQVENLWTRLVEVGAKPVGLGARDSLRTEARLPLYGHELGLAPNGSPIPIFANPLARFGVRREDLGFVGAEALAAQRAQIEAYASADFSHKDKVPYVVRPFEVLESTRPVRAGFTLHEQNTSGAELAQHSVGWVSSGASIPILENGRAPTGRLKSRSIGLAMLEPEIGFATGSKAKDLVAIDTRGKRLTVRLLHTT